MDIVNKNNFETKESAGNDTNNNNIIKVKK